MSRLRIILTILLPTLIVLAVVLTTLIVMVFRSGTREIYQSVEQGTAMISKEISSRMESIVSQVNIVAGLLSYQSDRPLTPVLEESLGRLPYVLAIGIEFDPHFLADLRQGKIQNFKLENFFGLLPSNEIPETFAPIIYRNKEGILTPFDFARFHYEREIYYLVALNQEVGIWTLPYTPELTEDEVVSYALPFRVNGEFAGIVAFALKTKNLFDVSPFLVSQTWGNPYPHYCVLDYGGRILYSSKSEVQAYSFYSILAAGNLSKYDETVDDLLNSSNGTRSIPLPYQDGRFVKEKIPVYDCVFSRITEETGWHLVFFLKRDHLLAPLVRQIVLSALFFLVAILFLCGTLATLFIRENRMILEVTEAAREIANGDLDKRVDRRLEKRKGTLGTLVHDFNKMAERIQLGQADRDETTRINKELDIAQNLQKALLPKIDFAPPFGSSLRVKGQLFPADKVAGDFFDYWMVDDNKIAFVIADVSGKGITASMVMVRTQTVLRQLVNSSIYPGEVLSRANNFLHGSNPTGMFVTLFFGIYQIDNQVLQYSNAGHNPPFLIKADGTIKPFEYADGFMLGVLPNVVYTTRFRDFDEGDSILLYTDGVTEAVAPSGQEIFGEEGLEKIIPTLRGSSPEKMIDGIVETVHRFAGKSAQSDDITLLLLKHS